jgi:hypothetical protein
VTLRLIKGKLRAEVAYALTAVDGREHRILDPSHTHYLEAIPSPRATSNSEESDVLEGTGGFSRTLTSANHAVRPGKPLTLTTTVDEGLKRGTHLKVSINASGSGPQSGAVLPPVTVTVGWSGCPTARLTPPARPR